VIHLRHLHYLQVNQKKIKTRRKIKMEKKLIVVKVPASPQKKKERRERLKGWPMIWSRR